MANPIKTYELKAKSQIFLRFALVHRIALHAKFIARDEVLKAQELTR
jgi:hypothetical protein